MKLKLGGHETFYLRAGWLTKGLLYLNKKNEGTFSTTEAADYLGVGSNMAKSIGYWLVTTGLATRKTRNAPMSLTEFGETVAQYDPYMVDLGTWWLIHAVAMTSQINASLSWFFLPQRERRIDRSVLIRTLQDDLLQYGTKPTLKIVQREVAAIMHTYAVPIPRSQSDPEDNISSPFSRLALWQYLRNTDHFERSTPTPVPPEALGIILSALSQDCSCHHVERKTHQEINLKNHILLRACTFLGQSFQALLTLATTGENILGKEILTTQTTTNERFIFFQSMPAADWARTFYNRFTLRNIA